MPWFLTLFVIVLAPLALLNWYVVRTLFRISGSQNSGLSRAERISVLFAIGWCNLLPLVALVAFLLLGRTAMAAFGGDSILVDVVFVYPFWIWLVVLVQLSVLLAVWHLVKLIGVKVFRRDRLRWNGFEALWFPRLVLAVTAISVGIILVQTLTVKIVQKDVDVEERFRALDGFRILHLSDVQGDGRTTTNKILSFAALANDLHPDVVMNSGDQVTSGVLYLAPTAEALSAFRSPEGHYAAIGDHDIFSNKQMVLAALRRNHIVVLEDTSVGLSWRGVPVHLAVVTYTYPQKPTAARLKEILGTPDNTFRILLVHQPAEKVVHAAAEAGYDLVLAGHTHGGGVAFGIPGLGVVAPASFESPFLSGFYRVGSMVVSVTNGLGFTLAPVRYLAPLEMTCITLRAPRRDR